MTNADRMRSRWRPGADVKETAREIDPRCRIETFLYSAGYFRIVFSDGSKVTFANGEMK